MAERVFGYSGGRHRYVVSARSKKAAHAAMQQAVAGRLSYFEWNQFSCVTGNVEEVKVAMSQLGVVFAAPRDLHGSGRFRALTPSQPNT